MNLVDMHIHSCYSDGTGSPQEILEEAERKGIKILAITDHDVLEGSRELLELGLDGVECWYPSHPEEICDICLRVCRERGLLITCGSDSHGQFEVEDTPMGILSVTEEQVVLEGLTEGRKVKQGL